MRDDFPQKVKEKLAQRVGVRCSNPSCRKPTSGPHEEPRSVVNIGVAAHITAAAPGGPRYDVSLRADERRSIDNGIWLCQNCAKLVDNDPDRYTVDVLRDWKRQSEELARIEVETSGRQPQESTRPAQLRIVPTERGAPPFLARLTTGDALAAVVEGACSSCFDHDRLDTPDEVDAVAGVLQNAQDYADIGPDLEVGEKVRMGVELNRSVEELEERGFYIFGGREIRQLEGGVRSPEPWPVAHLRVVRRENPTIIKAPFASAASSSEDEHINQESAVDETP